MGKLEIRKDGLLIRVDYFAVEDSIDIKLNHRIQYKHIPFSIQRKLRRFGTYRMDAIDLYSPNGAAEDAITILLDEYHCPWMVLRKEITGPGRGCTKYFWPTPAAAKYAFYFEPTGQPCRVFDLEKLSEISLEEAMGEINDPRFFTNPFTMPQGLSLRPQ